MIASLKGQIKSVSNRFVILEVGGVGYQIFISPIILNKFQPGQAAEFFTHLHVREDLMVLYGFLTEEELSFFGQLIEISGVGPKTALNVLSLAKVTDIKSAISVGDAAILTKVSGIGRKTAERIILELKNKFENLGLPGAVGGDNEVIDALIGLGYQLAVARELARGVPAEINDVSERIKWALKNIS
ncbi:MAG: Holliday junction branch migration protein RuvA [bacterium]